MTALPEHPALLPARAVLPVLFVPHGTLSFALITGIAGNVWQAERLYKDIDERVLAMDSFAFRTLDPVAATPLTGDCA